MVDNRRSAKTTALQSGQLRRRVWMRCYADYLRRQPAREATQLQCRHVQLHSGDGRCPTCHGMASSMIEMQYFSATFICVALTAAGRRFVDMVAEVKSPVKSIATCWITVNASLPTLCGRSAPRFRRVSSNRSRRRLGYTQNSTSRCRHCPAAKRPTSETRRLISRKRQTAAHARSSSMSRRLVCPLRRHSQTLLNAFEQLLAARVIHWSSSTQSRCHPRCDWIIDLARKAAMPAVRSFRRQPEQVVKSARSHTDKVLRGTVAKASASRRSSSLRLQIRSASTTRAMH